MKPMSKQLLETQRCGVYQLAGEPEELEHAVEEAGLAIFRIDIGDAHSKKQFLKQVAKALDFPDWFGGNWDALNDCLTDLEWLPNQAGYVLIFEEVEQFATLHRQEFDTALGVLRSAADYWKGENRPFWALFVPTQEWDSGLSRWPAQSNAK
jgi:RNAse (barnase) inhibitor barstar